MKNLLTNKNILIGLGLVGVAYFLAKKSKSKGNEVVAIGGLVGGDKPQAPKVLVKPAAPAPTESAFNGTYADGWR